MKKIIAISGSLRKGSFNTLLLQEMQKLIQTGFELEIASINEIPLYNADLEKEAFPKSVLHLKDKIIHSDALIISTPEYNYAIPGVLKNAIDWLSRPTEDIQKIFGNRPTGLVGASAGRAGTLLAQTAWLPILRYFNAKAYFSKSLYISSAHTLFDNSGIIKDEETKKRIKEYIDGFCSFLNQ